MTKRTTSKKTEEAELPDSDDRFAFIAGYTSGGAPYGVTWEEEEARATRAAARASQSPPPQRQPVSLKEVAQELQYVSDQVTIYYQRSTGEFVAVTEELLSVYETDESVDDLPAWQAEALQQVAEVMDPLHEQDYVPLPSRYEIHEYAIMEDFCSTVKELKIGQELYRAISGKGAFRRFKDTIHRHNLEERWYQFRDNAFEMIARDWCKEHGIVWND